MPIKCYFKLTTRNLPPKKMQQLFIVKQRKSKLTNFNRNVCQSPTPISKFIENFGITWKRKKI